MLPRIARTQRQLRRARQPAVAVLKAANRARGTMDACSPSVRTASASSHTPRFSCRVSTVIQPRADAGVKCIPAHAGMRQTSDEQTRNSRCRSERATACNPQAARPAAISSELPSWWARTLPERANQMHVQPRRCSFSHRRPLRLHANDSCW